MFAAGAVAVWVEEDPPRLVVTAVLAAPPPEIEPVALEPVWNPRTEPLFIDKTFFTNTL